jgi:hypothetical protein
MAGNRARVCPNDFLSPFGGNIVSKQNDTAICRYARKISQYDSLATTVPTGGTPTPKDEDEDKSDPIPMSASTQTYSSSSCVVVQEVTLLWADLVTIDGTIIVSSNVSSESHPWGISKVA